MHKVILLVNNGFTITNQTYKNLEIIENNQESMPRFINSMLDHTKADIYGFFDFYHLIDDEHAIETVVEIFSKFNYVNFIYTDSKVISADEKYSVPIVHPYFRPNIFSLQGSPINIPFFIKTKFNDKIFNEQLDILYLFDALCKLSARYIGYHMPKPLYCARLVNLDLSKDINNVKTQYI